MPFSGTPAFPVTALGFFLSAIAVHRWKVGFLLFAEFLQAAAVLVLPFVLRDLVDSAAAYDPDSGQVLADTVREPFFLFVSVAVFTLVISRISGGTLGFLAPVLRLAPRERLLAHLQKHAMNFFQTSHGGALGNRINDACNGLAMGLWTFSFEVWPILIQFAVSVVLLFLAQASLGWIMLIWTILYCPVIFLFGVLQARQIRKISAERSVITGRIVDLASNIHAVKAFANEENERQSLSRTMSGEVKQTFRFSILRETGAWFHALMGLAVTIGLLFHALSLYGAGIITLGDIAFVFSLILIVTERARALIWAITHFLEHIGQLSDGVATIMRPHILTDKPDAIEMDLPKKAEIRFENVSFSYESRVPTAVSNLDLVIPSGQKVGLIGPSGAGKSTLVNLLLRFYDVQTGVIRIGEHTIADITQSSLRRAISVIPQDTNLFHRSLMDNIRYGRLEASDDDVKEAARKAHADSFIMDMPDGYDTLVGERGLRLSGGQRQRIAIARAILKNAPILILDEATSALDSESERLIQSSLTMLMEGKTVIAIAHRLSTIAHLDRLIVMENGRIVEDGTHAELLQRQGLYARLWTMQSGGFLPE